MEEVIEVVNHALASEFHKHLEKTLNEIDKRVDDNQEVQIKLVSSGHDYTFVVDEIGYSEPSFIIFDGKLEDGSPIHLIQHISQINSLLMSVHDRLSK